MSSHLATGIKYTFQSIHNGNVVNPNMANVFVASDPTIVSVTLNPPTDPDGEPNWCFFKNLIGDRSALGITVSSGTIDGGANTSYSAPWSTGVLVIYDGISNWVVFSGASV